MVSPSAMAFPEAAGVDRICIRSCFFSMASLVEIAPYVTLHMSCLNQQLTLIVYAGVDDDESPQFASILNATLRWSGHWRFSMLVEGRNETTKIVLPQQR